MDLLRKLKNRIFGAKEEPKAFVGSYDEWTKKYFPVMKRKVSEALKERSDVLGVDLIRIDSKDREWLKRANDRAKESEAEYITFQEEDFSKDLLFAAIRTAA